MKAIIATTRELAVALLILMGVGAFISAVLFPAIFARHAAQVVDALETEGFDVQIKTPIGEASFDRVKAIQLERSDDEILTLRTQLMQANAKAAALANTIDVARDRGAEIGPTPEAFVEAPPTEWVVVAGATQSLERQRDTLRLVRDAGFPDAAVLHSGNWFQSAVVFPTRAEAEDALSELREVRGVDDGAYIRALSVYCPGMAPVPGEPDVFDCDVS